MDREQIVKEIEQILIATLNHENFEMRDDLTATDVDGWDSLSHMVIITEVESKFGVKFRLKELNKLKNMGTLIALVQSKL